MHQFQLTWSPLCFTIIPDNNSYTMWLSLLCGLMWISVPGHQTAFWTAGYATDSLVHKQQEVREPRYSSCAGGHYGKNFYSVKAFCCPSKLRLCIVNGCTTPSKDSFLSYLPWWSSSLRYVCFSGQDGVVDPMDSTLRDFSGRCIEEFVKWSIKQTTPKQQEKSPTNMKSLFKRIYSLALHPNGFKRLGAALAFNNIYRLFRYNNAFFILTL